MILKSFNLILQSKENIFRVDSADPEYPSNENSQYIQKTHKKKADDANVFQGKILSKLEN